MECQTLEYAHFIGKKWSIALLEEIYLGKFDGFNNTLKKSELTPKILSIQLKDMQKMGLIQRAKSKKTAYTITEKGKELRKIISEIKSFNKKWSSEENCTDKSCLECYRFSV